MGGGEDRRGVGTGEGAKKGSLRHELPHRKDPNIGYAVIIGKVLPTISRSINAFVARWCFAQK